MGGGGGTTVNYPQPSAEERALQRQQTELLKSQTGILQENIRQQELLAPFLYQSQGIKPIYDEQSRIIGYEQLPLTEEEQAQAQLQQEFLDRSLASLAREEELAPGQQEISRLLQERSLAALKGELPTDPTVLRQLGESETQLREQLFKQLGPGYETSTPGIQALAEFQKRRQEIIAGASRADLTLAEQLGMARQGAREVSATDYLNSQQLAQSLRQSRLGNILGIQQGGLTGFQGYGQLAQGYNQPINWFQQQRAGQFNADVASAQSAGSAQAGWGSLVGTGLMAAATFFSDPRLKTDIKPIKEALSKVKALRGVSHGWKRQPGEHTLGVLSTDVREVVPELVRRNLNLEGETYDTVDYIHLIPLLIEAIKDLSSQVDELKSEKRDG